MTDNLDLSIARIYGQGGVAVGTAFLVDDRRLLTCAHVVQAALGLAEIPQEMPVDTLKLDFPLRDAQKACYGRVAF